MSENMSVEVRYRFPGTTAEARAFLPVQSNRVFTLGQMEHERFVSLAKFNEALAHLELMLALNRQLQQRVDELEAQLATRRPRKRGKR